MTTWAEATSDLLRRDDQRALWCQALNVIEGSRDLERVGMAFVVHLGQSIPGSCLHLQVVVGCGGLLGPARLVIIT